MVVFKYEISIVFVYKTGKFKRFAVWHNSIPYYLILLIDFNKVSRKNNKFLPRRWLFGCVSAMNSTPCDPSHTLIFQPVALGF